MQTPFEGDHATVTLVEVVGTEEDVRVDFVVLATTDEEEVWCAAVVGLDIIARTVSVVPDLACGECGEEADEGEEHGCR